MPDNDTPGTGEELSTGGDWLARRSLMRGAGSVVAGGLGLTALTSPAAAGMTVELDVKSNINLESGGVIPAVVGAVSPTKGVAPMNLPVGGNVVLGPRFGPSRLFECDDQSPPGDPIDFPQLQQQQQQDDDLCALEQAVQTDTGATPAHGDGHRRGNGSAMLHFRTQEAGFVPEDAENGQVEVTLLYAIEDETGDVEAFRGTDVAGAISPSKGIAPMN